jgi:hypothetical protein
MIRNLMKKITVTAIFAAMLCVQAVAQDLSNPLTAAILPFSERGF